MRKNSRCFYSRWNHFRLCKSFPPDKVWSRHVKGLLMWSSMIYIPWALDSSSLPLPLDISRGLGWKDCILAEGLHLSSTVYQLKASGQGGHSHVLYGVYQASSIEQPAACQLGKLAERGWREPYIVNLSLQRRQGVTPDWVKVILWCLMYKRRRLRSLEASRPGEETRAGPKWSCLLYHKSFQALRCDLVRTVLRNLACSDRWSRVFISLVIEEIY